MSVGSGVPESAAVEVAASDPISVGEVEPELLDEQEMPADPITIIATISTIPWCRLLPKAENITDPPSSVARTIEIHWDDTTNGHLPGRPSGGPSRPLPYSV
jgi:hypothetical protein